MRELVSLLLAFALAAPFGDAGAPSLGGGIDCLSPAAAGVEADPTPGHGLGSGGPHHGRTFLPAQGVLAPAVEGVGGSAPSPRVPVGHGLGGSDPDARRLPVVGCLRPSGTAPSVSAFLQGFRAHPSTAPPLHT